MPSAYAMPTADKTVDETADKPADKYLKFNEAAFGLAIHCFV